MLYVAVSYCTVEESKSAYYYNIKYDVMLYAYTRVGV